MNKALLVGALLLTTGGATALSAVDAPKFIMGNGALTEEVLLGFLGERPETVRIISYNPDPVVNVVTWEESMELLAMTSFGNAMGTDNHNPRAAFLTGSDEGFGIVGSGFFCDNSSAWVGYGKEFAEAGMAYTRSEDLGPSNLITCGGFYGETRVWDLQLSVLPVFVAMQPRLNPGANGILLDGCYSTIWTQHNNEYCPASQTQGSNGPDTFTNWNASGTGVKTTLDFGSAYFDYFLGNGAETTYGNGITN